MALVFLPSLDYVRMDVELICSDGNIFWDFVISNQFCNFQMPPNGPKIVPLSGEERLRILKAVIPLEFPITSKFWKTADYVMNLASCSKFVVSIILQAVSEGWAR